jgi:molecular chaperone GrpE
VDAAVKENLLDQFRCYLDSIEEAPEEPEDAGAEADLFSVFVELAAVRNEVRTESRLVKEALDQFRGVFATLQSSHATLEQELKRVQGEARERGRALLRPLLLELLDLRDRLAAGLQQPAAPPKRRFDRWRRRRPAEPESWREGLGITLRRLDRILAERRVARIEMAGKRFDPRMGRVVDTTQDASVGAGIVVEEVTAGFMWDEELLRAAEVIVNKIETEQRETVG